MKQSYFHVSCSWPIETVPYWHDYNKYYTMNKHEHQVLSLWGHISNSCCFMKKLNCIQFALKAGRADQNWYTFWVVLSYLCNCVLPLKSACYIFQPPTKKIKWIIQWKWKWLKIRKAPSSVYKLESTVSFFLTKFHINDSGHDIEYLVKFLIWRSYPEVMWGGGC